MNDTAAPIRISGPNDLLNSIPVLVGHTPVDSIVAVVVTPERVVKMTARIDIPDHGMEGEAALTLAGSVLANVPNVHAILLIGYETTQGAAMPGMRAIADAFESAGVETRLPLTIRDGRFYINDDTVGQDMAPSQVPADLLAVGAGVPGVLAEMRQEAEASDRALPIEGTPDFDGAESAARRLILGIDMGRHEVAALALACTNLNYRDSLIAHVCDVKMTPAELLAAGHVEARYVLDLPLPLRETRAEWSRGLLTVASLVPDQKEGAHLLAVLAHFAVGAGDGVIMNILCRRIESVWPDHRLTYLLQQAVNMGMRPVVRS